jgi:excisionase family DNA binding protein
MENDLAQSLQFLTLQQTAEVLQLSRRTLLRMLKHKKLPAVKALSGVFTKMLSPSGWITSTSGDAVRLG